MSRAGFCLAPRRLSSMCAQRKAGRRLPSVPFPWSLAVHHQSLAFRARLCHAKNEAPEEEAVLDYCREDFLPALGGNIKSLAHIFILSLSVCLKEDPFV